MIRVVGGKLIATKCIQRNQMIPISAGIDPCVEPGNTLVSEYYTENTRSNTCCDLCVNCSLIISQTSGIESTLKAKRTICEGSELLYKSHNSTDTEGCGCHVCIDEACPHVLTLRQQLLCKGDARENPIYICDVHDLQ